MRLFDEYPCLEDESIILRKMTEDDAPALQAFAEDEETYRYLPTFLYEQKYADKEEAIARMDAECFDTGEGILLAVCFREAPDRLIGIAEIYNYEEKKQKASIGCRLMKEARGKGVGRRVVTLLRNYLIRDIGLRTITAHIMTDNAASAKIAGRCGFLNKYPDTYGDWGYPDLTHADKYVYKREWEEMPEGQEELPPVRVEQFVMAYLAEQDRIRAMLPDGFVSLRPVLRINAEIRDGETVYLEFNTPVEAEGRRGWLNIDFWKSSSGDDIHASKEGNRVTFSSPFLEITFTKTGLTGGCPAEKDNDGCFYVQREKEFRPAEKIDSNRLFCDCSFHWAFHEGDAAGVSEGKSIPAFAQAQEKEYPKTALTAENAAAIPCEKVLGAYGVEFIRQRGAKAGRKGPKK